MKKNNLLLNIYAILLAVGLAFAGPTVGFGQQQNCLTNKRIISLVKAKKITSFAKIERKLHLQAGAKIFGQKLCEAGSRYVYFFKVVDSYGRTKKFALYADDGSPYKG